MSEQSPAPATRPLDPPPKPAGFFRQRLRDWLTLRKPVSPLGSFALGVLCVIACLGGWWFVTHGEYEERIVGVLTLPSPYETFSRFPELFGEDFDIVSNTFVTLRRVALGFLLAVTIGVPLGILAGCFPWFNSFLNPVVLFGRNIPLAAILPLLLFISSSGEQRKVLFIFIACVAFVISDTARAVMDVASRYIDTAYTLGASRWQTIIKVLVPLAMPTIFGSFRVMFGLAFGYIMLAESIKNPNDVGGLGFQITTFQRRGLREHLYLIILIIPVVALVVDQILFWMQRQLFPHVYGGAGWLQKAVHLVVYGWDDLRHIFFHSDWKEPESIEHSTSQPSTSSPSSTSVENKP